MIEVAAEIYHMYVYKIPIARYALININEYQQLINGSSCTVQVAYFACGSLTIYQYYFCKQSCHSNRSGYAAITTISLLIACQYRKYCHVLKRFIHATTKNKKKKSKTQKYCLKIQNFRRDKEKIHLNRFKKKSGILEENSIQYFETRMLIAMHC